MFILKRATTTIKIFKNMTLKRGKNGYQNASVLNVRKNKLIYGLHTIHLRALM
jgi:hypothetical protein